MKSTGKSVMGIMLAGIVTLGLAAPRVTAGADSDIRLTVRVFRVPSPQSFEAVLLEGQGRPVTFQVSGDVASAFPRGTMFFQTELAANASEAAVAAAILDRIPLGVSGMPVKRLRIDELKALEFEVGPGHPEAEARFEESRGEGRTLDYEVRVGSLSSGKDNVLIRLRFDAGWSARGGSLGVGMSEDVLSAPFEVPESRLMLIGGAASGRVYWLAVSVTGPAK